MAGGQVTILWDRDDAAEVTITTAVGGGASFAVDGSPVTFPYSLTEDTTFVTAQNEAYRVSVKLNGVEIAAVPDGVRVANLLNGSELTFAPKPDDGFVSPSGGGGSPVTDGVGAVFFGGENLAVDFDNTYVFSPFIATDDPPRAPQRDDLVVIDEGDDTMINVVQSGLYSISLNVPVQPRDLVVEVGAGTVQLEAVIQLWVNGNAQPPAYDYNNRAQWHVSESDTLSYKPTVFTNWTFPQVLLAGDTIQLAVKAFAGVGLSGAVHLDPDITFVLTYVGPVA